MGCCNYSPTFYYSGCCGNTNTEAEIHKLAEKMKAEKEHVKKCFNLMNESVEVADWLFAKK